MSYQLRSFSHRRRVLAGGYTSKVLDTGPIAYWPLDEAAGAAAHCEVNSAQNGTYTGVTLAHDNTGPFGTPAPLFDGTNDDVDIYTAALDAVFDGREGTMMIWEKVFNAAVWADNVYRWAMMLGEDLNNRLQLLKGSGAESNELRITYKAGGVALGCTTAVTPTAWYHHALSWSKTADEAKAYYNGSQYDDTQTGLGTWSGGLSVNYSCIGMFGHSNGFHWKGWLAHAVVWDRVLTQAELTALANP